MIQVEDDHFKVLPSLPSKEPREAPEISHVEPSFDYSNHDEEEVDERVYEPRVSDFWYLGDPS